MANPALFVAGSPDQGTTKAIIKTDATGKLLTVGENADVVAALTTLKNTVATESSLQSLVTASEPVTSVLNTTHFAEQQEAIDSTAIDITPYENIFVEVSGTLAGANVTLKGSLDGDSFWSLMMTPCTSSELSKTSMDTQGIFSTNIAGLSHVQACLMGSTAETLVTVKSMATTLARAGASQVNVSDRASRKLGEVTLSGSFATLRPMLGATKTASGVASEVFAGESRLAGRRGVTIKNEHPYLRLRIDGAGVTDTTGIALEPFAQAVFEFDPEVEVPVYVISEAGLVRYGVVEW